MSTDSDRAFVFGLSLTELMILFVFLLALLVGDLFQRERLQAKSTSEQQSTVESLRIKLARMNKQLSVATRDQENGTSLTRTVVELEEKLQKLTLEQNGLKRQLGKIESDLGEPGTTLRAAYEALIADVQALSEGDTEGQIELINNAFAAQVSTDEIMACQTELKKAHADAHSISDSLVEALARSDAAEIDQQNCQGQLKHQQKLLKSAGKGSSYPPCWAPDGKIAYLFKITMVPSGFDIQRAWPDKLAAEASKVPGAVSLIGMHLSPKAFAQSMSPILSHSKALECRHYVRVIDRTGDDKDLYKRQLAIVERYFYKYLVNN